MVYPKDGPTNKQTGRRCERFGPLESFSLDLSDKKLVQVGNRTCCWADPGVSAAVVHCGQWQDEQQGPQPL